MYIHATKFWSLTGVLRQHCRACCGVAAGVMTHKFKGSTAAMHVSSCAPCCTRCACCAAGVTSWSSGEPGRALLSLLRPSQSPSPQPMWC